MCLDNGCQTKVKDDNNKFDQTHLWLLYHDTYENVKGFYRFTTEKSQT